VPDAGPRDEGGEPLPVRTGRYMDEEWLTARPVRFACLAAAIACVATSPGWDSAAVRRAATAPTQALAVIA
jgi:hypothetical protein